MSQNGLPSKSKKRSPGDGSGSSANPDAGCGVRSFQLSVVAEPRLELQRGLVVEPLEGRLGHARGPLLGRDRAAERRKRRHSTPLELLDLAAADPGDAGEVVDRVPVRVAERLEVADAALRAGERLGLGRCADELLEPLADAPVVRAELARRERLLRLVPEQHVDVRRLEPLDPRDLLAVEAELEDVGGLRVAGELGVERLVAPRAERGGRLDAHQEVGLPAPAVAREDALVDDVDAVLHRLDGLARGALPVAVGLELDRR